jgi:ribose-phosphate pyrophosphokinase
MWLEVHAVNTRRLAIISGQTCQSLAEEVCALCGVEPVPVRYGVYDNENQFAHLATDLAGMDVFVIQTTRPPVDFHVMQLLFVLEAARRKGAGRLTAVTPYFPYSRSNGHAPGEGIWARLIADMILAAGARGIIAFDLIARQVQGFAPWFVNLETKELLAGAVRDMLRTGERDDVAVVAPDMLPLRAAFEFSYRLQVPFAGMIYLERNKEGRRIRRADGESVRTALVREVKGKTILLYDDEIDTGKAMCRAAEMIMNLGSKEVIAVSPHAVLCGDAVENLCQSPLAKIVVTDTIPAGRELPDKFVVVPVAEMLAKAILHSHGSFASS